MFWDDNIYERCFIGDEIILVRDKQWVSNVDSCWKFEERGQLLET